MYSAFTRIPILLLAVSIGCSREPVQAEPTQPQQTTTPVVSDSPTEEPQAIALHICQYSLGSFPNWMQYPEFERYLSPSEARAIHYMADRLLDEVPRDSRDKKRAISAFIAQNTYCIPAQNDRTGTKDQTGAIGFSMIQKYPRVPNVPGISCASGNDSCVTQWINHFTSHWRGDYLEQPVDVVLVPDGNHYILRSAIDKSYAMPLKIRTFGQALDKYDFELAAQNLWQLCESSPLKCQKLKPFLTTSIEFARQSASHFLHDVTIENIRFQAVALSGNSGYVAAELTLNHHGDLPFAHIIFKTDEFPPQYCELQEKRANLDKSPITLLPQNTHKAWCILNYDTSPQVTLSPVVADAVVVPRME